MQMQQLTALIATATTNNAPDPAAGGGGARVHYNPAGTRCVCYPPTQGVKRTGVYIKFNPICTCSSCTKNWVTHADGDCLELEKNTGNCKLGWESYFI